MVVKDHSHWNFKEDMIKDYGISGIKNNNNKSQENSQDNFINLSRNHTILISNLQYKHIGAIELNVSTQRSHVSTHDWAIEREYEC